MANLTERDMARLWGFMTSAYGHTWLSAHGPGDDDGVWLAALADLTPDDLATGVRTCVRADPGKGWPPTLPQFRRLCRGIPEADVAVEHALRGEANHEVTARMLATVSEWDRRTLGADAVRRRLRGAYADAVDWLDRDGTTPVPALTRGSASVEYDARYPLLT